MPDHAASAASSRLRQELARIRSGELAPVLRHDLTSYSGPSIAFGISLAAAAYAIILAGVFLVFGLAQIVSVLWFRGLTSSDFEELALLPVLTLALGVFGAVPGMIWTALLSTITLPIVYLFVRSLKLRGSLVWLGAICGGLVGFLSVLPLILGLHLMNGLRDLWALLVILPLGPGLATITGQIGGAWGGRKAAESIESYYGLAAATTLDRADNQTAPDRLEAAGAIDGHDRRLQFGLRHLLWLIVWLSLLLSIVRLSGIPFQFVLPVLAGWLIYQAITLYIGYLIIRKLSPWWTTRRAHLSRMRPISISN
jgi:hypothetical protein